MAKLHLSLGGNGGKQVSINNMTKQLIMHGRILRQSEIFDNRDILRGAGSKCFEAFDRFIIMQLYAEDPSRSLKNYVDWP